MMEEFSFGAWIRRRRKAMDLTQQELARRINCSLSTIVKIESDQRRPSHQVAELLAKHLDIPESQAELFLKVARGLKAVDQMAPLPISGEPLLQTIVRSATHSFPKPTNPLIGRKPELKEILRLLGLPECRLLTIAGQGGVGKTRLAVQVGEDLSAANPPPFPEGIWFVSLAPITTTDNIPKAISQAIGFNLAGPLTPEVQLLNYLQEKTLLLLLDNAEHLLEGAEIFAKILEGAPGVKLLVTSRERLNLKSEWIIDLQGLPVPPLDAHEGSEEYSAVKLFLDRVRQVQNDFSLQEEDGPVVDHICRMLDGIPLGIELAAAWVRTLPLGEIAAEIAHDLDFLTTSARDRPERHRSLRVVFDHSWSLLLPAEQHALRKLSVFKGGFTREAAQDIAETPLPILNSLIDKSLLRRSESARYDLHELVRGYAAIRLAEATEEEACTQARHSRFFLSLVCEAGTALQSNRQKEALARLSPEMANIRLAWTWALAHDQIELLGEAAQSQWYFFELLNYYREGEAVFARAADVVRRDLQEQKTELAQEKRRKYVGALAQFLMHEAYFAMRLGRVDEAEALFLESISSLRTVDDPEALARAQSYYAFLNWHTSRLDKARDLMQECLPLSRIHGTPWQIALFTGFLGNVAYERGEFESSYRLLSEALERSQVIGDPRLIGYMSAYLGRTALKLKRIAEIEATLQEGARITRESGDRFCFGLILEQLAMAAHARGDFISAEKHFQVSANIFREMEDAWYLSHVLTSWGDLKLSLGEHSSAAERFRQAIRTSLEAQTLPVALNALLGLARVYALEGKVEPALEIAICILNHPASPQDAISSAELIQRNMELQFSSDEVEAIYQRAHSQTLEQFARIQM